MMRVVTPLLAVIAGACSGVCQGAFVLDQIGEVSLYNLNPATDPTPSQIYTDFPDFSSAVLEDFTVASDELEITQVSALFRAQAGFDKFESVSGYRLNFFSDPGLAAASLAGDVASFLVVAGSGALVTQVTDGGGLHEYGLVSLNVDFELPAAGQYWVSVSPESASAVTGQFFLMNQGASGPVTPGGLNARLANPGDGFELGALTVLNLDHAYSVSVVPEPAGVIMVMLGGLGMVIRRKRFPLVGKNH